MSDGNGAAGRALIDSVISATPAGAPLYPQALFWRASLASNAADAESDYRHIVVDYPLAPQAEDALLRLAQLELARGDREGALVHLQRIQRDYPRSKSLARASYWMARVLFEKNDVPNACAANSRALAQADSGEVELRNQIQYQGQRCPAAVTAAAAAATSAPASAAPPPVAAGNVATPNAAVVSAPAPQIKSAAGEVEKPQSADPGKAHVAAADSEKARPTRTPEPEPKPTREPEKPRQVEISAAVPAASAPPAKTQRSTASAANPEPIAYSIQVAAYTHRVDAESLASTLKKRGYEARVDGSTAPFRVRIGRYSTNAEAEDELKKIKTKHMDGFVARVPAR